MEKLERILAQWIERENQCGVSLSTLLTQARAKSLVDDLNVVDPDPKVQSFAASAGWFERFKV
jgi:hypothetical protein